MSLLKSRGTLESRLRPQGIDVVWTEFPSGPPLLDSMNSGSVHFGHTGDSPPLFAQAAGVPMRYVGASTPSPSGSAILVPPRSPIQRVEDLKGKKVGFTKGSSGHALVLRALTRVGLKLDDVESVYLTPADARAALEGGSIDAWSIWDPYTATAEASGEARVLVRGDGLVTGREYYLASERLVEKQPEAARAVLEELGKLHGWAKANPEEVAKFQAASLGLSLEAMRLAEGRRGRYGFDHDAAAWTAEEQRLADEFEALGLLPRRLQVKAVVQPLLPGPSEPAP